MQQAELLDPPLGAFDQAGVLQRQRRLVGEQLQQVEIALGERRHTFAAHDVDDPDDLSLPKHRRRQDRPEGRIGGVGVGAVRPGAVVGNDQPLPRLGCPSGRALPVSELDAADLNRELVGGRGAQNPPGPVGEVEPSRAAIEEMDGAFEHTVQQARHIAQRDQVLRQTAQHIELAQPAGVQLLRAHSAEAVGQIIRHGLEQIELLGREGFGAGGIYCQPADDLTLRAHRDSGDRKEAALQGLRGPRTEELVAAGVIHDLGAVGADGAPKGPRPVGESSQVTVTACR